MIKANKTIYRYPKCVRSTVDGKRVYDINDGAYKLPSVTTILSATQSAEKRESLAAWSKTGGRGPVQRGSWLLVAARGTAMHKISREVYPRRWLYGFN